MRLAAEKRKATEALGGNDEVAAAAGLPRDHVPLPERARPQRAGGRAPTCAAADKGASRKRMGKSELAVLYCCNYAQSAGAGFPRRRS